MKKSVCSALILLLSLSVQGCTGQPKETETQPVTQMQMELELETLHEVETESESETEAVSAEKTEDSQVSTIIGSLVDIDMEQITVLSDNGNEIILPIKEAELDFSGGFRVGNLVAVNYTGELLETDNLKADISVLRAADSSDVQELEISAPRKNSENEDDEAATETADTDEGAETGDEDGTEETETEETEAPETESGTEAESETEKEALQTIRGDIQNLDRNSMTILTEDKEELTFGIMNVQMYFSKGMAKGTKVVVAYTGEFTGDGQSVVSVTDAGSFTEKEDR